jgi:hypothetical protein
LIFSSALAGFAWGASEAAAEVPVEVAVVSVGFREVFTRGLKRKASDILESIDQKLVSYEPPATLNAGPPAVVQEALPLGVDVPRSVNLPRATECMQVTPRSLPPDEELLLSSLTGKARNQLQRSANMFYLRIVLVHVLAVALLVHRHHLSSVGSPAELAKSRRDCFHAFLGVGFSLLGISLLFDFSARRGMYPRPIF